MDSEDSIECKCENLMNIVVESRKRFGKMCVDYEHKSSLMENKILNLKIETFSNYRFKPKNPVPDYADDKKEMEAFTMELIARQNRIQELRTKLKNTQNVVLQLKNDKIGNKIREPLSAESILTHAKGKII
ncbi:hypothetical protein O3G_MSEX012169 [Manduca sexta]|uniref:Uncharacterized protein n=1 Tax=Manduca sexta TaxID=7130 RepID=A0A921ZMD9_MANSE|nr:hypothetical protein O3G_MSEX012169 [Manduca sexta]